MSDENDSEPAAERKERCDRCRFWEQWESLQEAKERWEYAEPLGSCLRHAPLPRPFARKDGTAMSDASYEIDPTIWPTTEATDWCGEFESAVDQASAANTTEGKAG